MNKISRISRKFRILFQVLLVLQPIGVALFWILVNNPVVTRLTQAVNSSIPPSLFLFTSLSDRLNHVVLEPSTRLFGFLVSMLPASIAMFGLYQLVKLFQSYEAGDIFTIENVRRYRKLGYTLFASVFAGIIYEALITLVITFHNSPGKRAISLSFGTNDVIALIIGGVVLLISWVMMEAQTIAEEQVYTI